MKRLTIERKRVFGAGSCWELVKTDSDLCTKTCVEQGGDKGCSGCPIAEAIDKLAAYENTGYQPEEIPRKLDGITTPLNMAALTEKQKETARIIKEGYRLWCNRYETKKGEYEIQLILYNRRVYLWKKLNSQTVEFKVILDRRVAE